MPTAPSCEHLLICLSCRSATPLRLPAEAQNLLDTWSRGRDVNAVGVCNEVVLELLGYCSSCGPGGDLRHGG